MATARKATPEEAERQALGLDDPPKRERNRPWEAWEIGYLEAFYGKDPPESIATSLDRSGGAILHKARKLGLVGRCGPSRMRPPKTPALAELAALRDAYAGLERREQQAREQVARLVAELDQIKARPLVPVAKAAPSAVTDEALKAEIQRLWVYLAVNLCMVSARKAARRLGVTEVAMHTAMVRAGVAGAALVEPELSAREPGKGRA